MYLYFDKMGNLKEQINDEALRQGNSNINKLYVFWEKAVNNANITALWSRFKADDGTYYPSSTTWSITTTTTTETIPYDKNRDLKFFNYFTEYKFYVVTLPDEVLGQNGSWLGTLQFVETNAITTLGQLAFYVSESNSSVEADENINIAQWNYLIEQLSEIEGTLDNFGDDYVTIATNQVITGQKTLKDDLLVYGDDGSAGEKMIQVGNTKISGYGENLNGSTEIIFQQDVTSDTHYQLTLPKKTGTIAITNDLPTKTSDLTNDSGYITNITSSDVTTALGYTPGTSNFSGSYNDLTNKPTIPTKTSDLSNDSGFITGISSSDVTSALGYTPYNSTNPNGYQDATQVQTKINNAISNVYQFLGSISVADLNEFIVQRTDPISELKGYVYNITDSGNLNNYTGTTSVVAGDNVAFVYISDTNWSWDKLVGTIDTSNFVTLNGTQDISGKKTFTNASGVYLTEQSSTPASTDGLQAQDDNHLYWKGQKIPLNSDIPTKTSDLNNDSGFITNSSLTGYVPTSRKVNNKALTGDITLTASDVGALSSSTTYVSSVNGSSGAITNIATTSDVNAKMSNPMTTQDDIVIGGSSGTPTRLAKGSNNELLGVNNSGHLAYTKGLPYITTAPSSNNTNGGLIIVVLSSEPSTYYDGYYYIITGSNS